MAKTSLSECRLSFTTSLLPDPLVRKKGSGEKVLTDAAIVGDWIAFRMLYHLMHWHLIGVQIHRSTDCSDLFSPKAQVHTTKAKHQEGFYFPKKENS